MNPKMQFPEPNQKVGLYYALTDDGIELTVIDVTHLSFFIVNPPDLPQRIEKAMA